MVLNANASLHDEGLCTVFKRIPSNLSSPAALRLWAENGSGQEKAR
jgi:hypothetical protein